MPDIYFILDSVVVVALIGLGVTVLVKDTSSELNRIFALFVTCISVWIIANYLSNDLNYSARTAVIANYFVFSFSYAASIFLLRFSASLAGDRQSQKILKWLYAPLFLIAGISATPLVVAGAHIQGELYAVEFGPLATVYFITVIANIVMAVYIVRRNIKRTHGDQKARLRVLFKSLCWTFPVLLLAQAVVPATTGWFGLTNIGVLPMLILVYGIYYGVVKHRLFDLRLIIVRSIAYVLTLGLISVFYGVATHYIADFFASRNHGSLARDVINIALITIVVLSYGPLKRTFNKITNRFFYRDAYDPQLFFNDFNQALVASVELGKLLKGAATLIAETLKADYCTVILRDGARIRTVGSSGRTFDAEIAPGSHLLGSSTNAVVVTDYLSDEGLKSLLVKNNIAALARLTSGSERRELGFVIFGAKQSGNLYNSQDLRVMETLANELVIAIQNSLRFEEIQRFNVTLQDKISEATRKLRKTNERLRILDQTKDDFISMASHQLRTPLTSVKGYVSMVLDGDGGKINETQRKLLTQSFLSSQRMVYLISDLLNVSRLKTGKFVIEPVESSLDSVIEEELAQLTETVKSRGLELSYHKPDHFPTLLLDETKIRQVIMNFVDNAIYYTPTGGHINVYLVDKPDSIEFTVVDDGIGVPKHEQHHLFGKFYRAKNAKNARPDGTGLGIFMAKKVIIAQGGAVIFRSTEGKGSTFGFTFPKAKLLPKTPSGVKPAVHD